MKKDNNIQTGVDAIISQINKVYGESAVSRLDSKPDLDVETISSGSIGLDLALGVGGYPKGRIIEIYGQPSSGKTTLTLHAIAEAQKLNLPCAFIDAEHAFDSEYAKAIGVNFHNLVFNQPDNGEQALEICSALVKSGEFAIIVVDSVAALTPKAEIDGEIGESKIGLQARMMSQAMRKLTGLVKKSNTILIFINQTRMKIGITYGNPETTTGGEALKFYSSIRLEVKRSTQMKDSEGVFGNLTKVVVAKNKVAPPFKQCEFNIIYGVGISRIDEIITYGSELEIIKKAGSWYSYEDIKLGQGAEKVAALLKDNPELMEEIETKIAEAIKKQ